MIRSKYNEPAPPRWRKICASAAVCFVILLALSASFVFATYLSGPGDPSVRRLDTGWYYLHDGTEEPIDMLPHTFDVTGEPIRFCRSLTEEETLHSRYVLVLRSRYASVRAWADDDLIYEAAQGEEHALGSMWHFIPMSMCIDAERLTVELHPYGSSRYTLDSIFMDTPGAVRYELLTTNLFAILFAVGCLLLAAAMLLATILLAVWKSKTYLPTLAFTVFLMLSGLWILLDSKITTMEGGNYALSYFMSYAAFYLLIAPLMAYIRLMTKDCRRLLSALIWAVILNAGLSFILHMTGLVHLRNTAVSVHVLIIISLPVSFVALWRSAVQRREKYLRWSFAGLLSLYVFGLISLVLYYMNKLPAANSTHQYMIGLVILIICITVDMIASFGQFWKEKESADRYRRLAVLDSMTEMGNRNAFEIKMTTLTEEQPEEVAFILFDVDSLKQINDQMGHHVGDQAIYMAAQCIKKVFGQTGDCYRIGGDEFAVIVTGKHVSQIDGLLEDFREEETLRWDSQLPSCGISYGWASGVFSEEKPVTQECLDKMKEEADCSLYRQKQIRTDNKRNN